MATRDEALALLTGPGSPFEIGEDLVAGRTMRVYKNAPPNLRAVWEITALHGDASYLVYRDPVTGAEEVLTYAAAHRQVNSLARHLHDDLGVAKGDRVAIGMRNYPEWILAFWACQSIGAVVVSLNAWWTATELEYGIDDSGTSVAIVDDERFERLAALPTPTLHTLIVARSRRDLPASASGKKVVGWEATIARDDATLPQVDIRPDDDATILYTSGTTGLPKGAVGSHRNHVTNLNNTIINTAVQMVMAASAAPPAEETPAAADAPPAAPARTVALWTFPFFHIAGVTGVYVITATGGVIVSQYKWDAGEALDLIEQHKVTVVAGVPTVVRSLIEHPDAAARDLSTVAGITQGGSPVPPDSIDKIESGFGGKVSPGNGYGLTETTSAVVANSGTQYFAKKDSVGLPVPVADVRIVDEAGHDVPLGAVGELWVYGPNNVRGYWNKPEETAKAFTDGWFHTGDAARQDEDGFIYVVDRIKDMVLRGGENVYCAEVEAALFQHPAVGDVAIVGVPHTALGEEVAAVIVRREGEHVTGDELEQFLSDRLAKFKIPTIWNFRESIPRNATGKVLKRDLRDELAN
jgi:long-chain acyl-CoA synthetase